MSYYNPSKHFLRVNSIKLQFDLNKQRSVKKVLDAYAPRKQMFKTGSNVMLTMNMLGDGLANGSQGIIKELGENYVTVLFPKDKLFKVCLAPHYLLVGRKFYVRFQVPLMLSWACTIHKTHGLTMEKAIIDLGPNVFAPSQAYVALSRVRTIKGVYLLRYDPKSIKADKEALDYAIKVAHMGQ